MRQDRLRRAGLVLGLFLVATVAFTWPVAAHLTTHIPGIGRDSFLNTWAMVWESRALVRLDFANVFNGNIFYPNKGTVLFSEALIGWQPVALPVYALSRSPVLVYNVVFLLSFVFTGWCTYLLVRGLTGSTAGGMVAGLAFAFGPFRLAHLLHVQVLSAHWTPLTLLCLHRFFTAERVSGTFCAQHPSGLSGKRYLTPFWGWAAAAGAAFAMQMLTCLYLGVFLVVVVVVFGVYFLLTTGQVRSGRTWLGLGLAGLIAAAGSGWLWPLYCASQAKEVAIYRRLEETERYSASPRDYFIPSARCWVWSKLGFTERGGEREDRWPGVVVPLLALVGVVSAAAGRPRSGTGGWQRRRVVGFYVLLMGAAAVLSLGPTVHLSETQSAGWGPFGFLRDHVPGFRGIRAPGRFSVFVSLSLAVLAGCGVSALVQALRRPRRGAALVLVVTGLLLVDFVPAAPLPRVDFPIFEETRGPAGERIPPPPCQLVRFPVDDQLRRLCRWLESIDGPVVVAHLPIPMLGLDTLWLEHRHLAPLMLHGRPAINGGSRDPPTYTITAETLARFPHDDAIRVMQGAGVTHVVVHPGPEWSWDLTERDLRDDRLSLVKRFGASLVYELAPLAPPEAIPAPIVATPIPPGTILYLAMRLPWSRTTDFGIDPGRWHVTWIGGDVGTPPAQADVEARPWRSGPIYLAAAVQAPETPGRYAVRIRDSLGRFDHTVPVTVSREARIEALDPPPRAGIEADVPQRLRAGSHPYLTVHLKNLGQTVWPARSGDPPQRPDYDVRLGWYLLDQDGNRMASGRCMLRCDLGPGQAVEMGFFLYLPARPGRYSLTIDPIVERHKKWFKRLGSTPWERTIEVQ